MGILKSAISIIGPVGEFTFYKVPGSNQIRVRRRAGPSREQIKTGKNFATVRLYNNEFAGRVLGSQLITRAFAPVKHVINYRLSQALHKPLQIFQNLDATNKLGERRICFSEHPTILTGFSLTKRKSLLSVIDADIQHHISETGAATIYIPPIRPNVNLFMPQGYSWFKISAVLASVPDLHVIEGKYASPLPDLPNTLHVSDTTPWLSAQRVIPGHTLRLTPRVIPASKNFVWMLSLAIEVGVAIDWEDFQTVKKLGAGMVLDVVPGGMASRFHAW